MSVYLTLQQEHSSSSSNSDGFFRRNFAGYLRSFSNATDIRQPVAGLCLDKLFYGILLSTRTGVAVAACSLTAVSVGMRVSISTAYCLIFRNGCWYFTRIFFVHDVLLIADVLLLLPIP